MSETMNVFVYNDIYFLDDFSLFSNLIYPLSAIIILPMVQSASPTVFVYTLFFKCRVCYKISMVCIIIYI